MTKTRREKIAATAEKRTAKLLEGFNPNEPFEYPLENRIELGATEFAKLTFQPLTAGDMWDIKTGEQTLGDTFELAARMTGCPVDGMKRLKGADPANVLAVVDAFLAASLGTGED